MFICINNLVHTELLVEEVLLIPEPLHYKLLDSNLLMINDKSWILTNLSGKDSFLIDQFQEQLREFGFKEKLNLVCVSGYLNISNFNKIESICEDSFPKLNIKHILQGRLAIEQGFIMATKNSSL